MDYMKLDSRVSKVQKLRLRWRRCWQALGGQTTKLFIYSLARWRFQRNFVTNGCNFV